jgi:hypothetical protein
LAFTPPGAPVTWITGLADGRGGDGVADGRVAAVADCLAAGRDLSPPAAGAQAATLMAMTATAVSQAIRILVTLALMGGRRDEDMPQSRGMEADDDALRAYYDRGMERERG